MKRIIKKLLIRGIIVIIGLIVVSVSFPFLKTRYLLWELRYTKYLTISPFAKKEIFVTDDKILVQKIVSSIKLINPRPSTLCFGFRLYFFLKNGEFICIDYLPMETGNGGFIGFWHPLTRWFRYTSNSEFDKNIEPILEKYYGKKRFVEYMNEMKGN
jgi:hypothetical protein